MAEIIPSVPVQDNACVGNKQIDILPSSPFSQIYFQRVVMGADINIYINSKLQKLPSAAKIKDLLDMINVTSHNGIALAVNNNVIPKAEWETYVLTTEDKVTLIKATQGG